MANIVRTPGRGDCVFVNMFDNTFTLPRLPARMLILLNDISMPNRRAYNAEHTIHLAFGVTYRRNIPR